MCLFDLFVSCAFVCVLLVFMFGRFACWLNLWIFVTCYTVFVDFVLFLLTVCCCVVFVVCLDVMVIGFVWLRLVLTLVLWFYGLYFGLLRGCLVC